jgi:hypothetical protein
LSRLSIFDVRLLAFMVLASDLYITPAAGVFAGVAVTIAGLPTVAINWSPSAGIVPRSARIARPHAAPMVHKRRTPIALALIHQFASPAILMWGQAETMAISTRLGLAVPFASPAAFSATGWICTLSFAGRRRRAAINALNRRGQIDADGRLFGLPATVAVAIMAAKETE